MGRPAEAVGKQACLPQYRAGEYGRHYPKRTREISEHVEDAIEDGDAIIAWAVSNDAGYDLDTCCSDSRMPVDVGGTKLGRFLPLGTLFDTAPAPRRGSAVRATGVMGRRVVVGCLAS